MRFYYLSIFSLILLSVIYVAGTGLLVWFGSWLRRRWRHAWIVIAPLFALLLIGPIAEELWIAWNFGQACKRDAGTIVAKTVEVDGFYDATAGLLNVYNPVDPRTAEHFDKSGYKFYEMSLSDPRGGPTRVVHYEKVNGAWTPTTIDHPTARYHYSWPAFNASVSHKVFKQSEEVTDVQTGDALGRSNRYGRKSPWFFVGLDDPGMSCPAPGEDSLKRPGLLYKQVLQAATHHTKGIGNE